MWIDREISNKIKSISAKRPAILLTGARQTGKTSLLRHLFPNYQYISLDLPLNAELAERNGTKFLKDYPPPIVIDEVQYAPELFRYLKIAIDANRDAIGQFLLTGSQKFSLMQNITESLAGRVSIMECLPLSLRELEGFYNRRAQNELLFEWLVKGGYPEIYRRDLEPTVFYSDYVATYLERDVRQLIAVKDLRDFERFMRLLALRSGQLLSYTGLATDIGISPNTVKNWITVLEASQVIHLLEPFYKNPGKRLKKTPKVFFMDTGLCCFLLGLSSPEEVLNSTHVGHLFETLVFGQIYRNIASRSHIDRLYFYRDHRAREVDFIIESGMKYRLIEVKCSENPKRIVPGFEAFEEIVGSEKIIERRIVTTQRELIEFPECSVGNPVDWD